MRKYKRLNGLFIVTVSVILIAVFIPQCSDLSSQDSLPQSSGKYAEGRNGVVSSAHPLATEAGLAVLRQGGNAFDAAVTVAAVLSVVEQYMSGLGGYGTILTYDAKRKKVRFLNASGKIPHSVDSDVYRYPYPNYRENRRGAKSVSTPGNLHAWEALFKEYGSKQWEELFEPAIELAEKGFRVGRTGSRMIGYAYDTFPRHAKNIFGKNGRPLEQGELLVQNDLAETYKAIAQKGSGIFYTGKIAAAIDTEMKKYGGFLSKDDLNSNEAEWWEPVKIDYRGHTVYTASPPATAFPSLIRLGIMRNFDCKKLGHNSTAYLHLFAEATKHAFWCRLAYAGDPDYNPPPLKKLLSDQYLKEQAQSIDPHPAKPFRYPGKIPRSGKNTTHFVVADKWGNIVSATQTLGNLFGSRIMPEGTGFFLNNSLAYCTFEPKGNPMDAHAGHRKLSGDCPTIICKNGLPWAALGTPGGHTIGQVVPQIVMNLIDFDMDIYSAIEAPKISFIEPDEISVEQSAGALIIRELEKLGHKIQAVSGLGNAHGLTIEYGGKKRPVLFKGASDPRGAGIAKGF